MPFRGGKKVVDLSFAGGFVKGSNIFKSPAPGSPYAKLICMGRAMMIPGSLGSNIEGALFPERREQVCGNWDKLPANAAKYGSTPGRNHHRLPGPEEEGGCG